MESQSHDVDEYTLKLAVSVLVKSVAGMIGSISKERVVLLT